MTDAEHRCADPRAGLLRLDGLGRCFWCAAPIPDAAPNEPRWYPSDGKQCAIIMREWLVAHDRAVRDAALTEERERICVLIQKLIDLEESVSAQSAIERTMKFAVTAELAGLQAALREGTPNE